MLKKLHEFMLDDAPVDDETEVYSLYGDPVYPQSISILEEYG